MSIDNNIREAIQGKPDKIRQSLMERWEDYVLACRLSNGPDPVRSRHWSLKAMVLENALKAAVGLIPRREIA